MGQIANNFIVFTENQNYFVQKINNYTCPPWLFNGQPLDISLPSVLPDTWTNIKIVYSDGNTKKEIH